MDSSFAEGIQRLSLQFPPFVMAVIFHEYAHGYIANKWGDNTAEASGRLTLNPVPHMDPLGTVLFPLMMMFSGVNFLFGWAKPVPINPNRFRKYRPGLFWVSIAGPIMNCILAILSAIAFMAMNVWMPKSFYLFEPLVAMMMISVSLNYALAVFNLLPLPPLDGSKIIESFLSYNATQKFEVLNQYSFFILMALLWTGALSVLAIPIRFLTNATLYGVAHLFHLLGAV
jgi:Zn-dependent protease